MINGPEIPAKLLMEWTDDMARLRPPPVTQDVETACVPILSFNAGASKSGVYLRMLTSGGTTFDLFLNAAVATQMADVIRRNGIATYWLNEDDGSIIVKDPKSLSSEGRKS